MLQAKYYVFIYREQITSQTNKQDQSFYDRRLENNFLGNIIDAIIVAKPLGGAKIFSHGTSMIRIKRNYDDSLSVSYN